MRLSIRVVTIVGLALLGQAQGKASTDVALPWLTGGTGAERGVVQIRCGTNVVNMVRLSRGAMLQLNGEAKSDLVLAAAHGLPESRDAVLRACRVLGAHGRPYRIANIWRSARSGTDMTDDWAVVLVRGRLAGDVGRLTPARVTGDKWTEIENGEASVRVLLRQAELREGDCRLRPSMAPYEYRPTELLVYACSATSRAAGLSGSPLMIGVEGMPFVIGVHLGWGLQMFDDGRLHAVSLGRPIDGAIAAAIADAAKAALQ
ncbi:MAG: hypothetical protein ABI640_06720 [Gammaproteobacteria bacterium]